MDVGYFLDQQSFRHQVFSFHILVLSSKYHDVKLDMFTRFWAPWGILIL